MKSNNQKPYFFQIIIAFIIDIFLINLFVNIISIPFINSSNLEKLSKESDKVVEEYSAKKIDFKQYFYKSMDINYEISRNNGIITIIDLVIGILYYVVFQIYNNGQTIGKKLLKLKVVQKDGSNLNMNSILIRSMIVNSILIQMILFAFMIFVSKELYINLAIIFTCIQYVILLISAIMIILNTEARGIYDYISNTKVIKVN